MSNAICNAWAWVDSNEANLVSYAFFQLIFLVAVTVLPGRIARVNAVLSMEMLSLKQVFVRYVSHEIRSPLNVVHAGLDILRDELRERGRHHGKGKSTKYAEVTESDDNVLLELVQDIFAASDSAINILNDLLNYEHMDAGTFKLDLSWKPLMGVFEGKLKWTELLAMNKDVTLRITDETVTTDAGIRARTTNSNIKLDQSANTFDLLEGGSRGSSGNIGTPSKQINSSLRSTDSESGSALLAGAYLHMDSFKIDQVIRNMVTNAMKFTPAKGTVEVKLSCEPIGSVRRAHLMATEAQHVVGYLRVDVIDSGAGISTDDQTKVFGEFTQFNKNDLQGGGGSGLGLWISRRIVNMHNGKMGFFSKGAGFGSTFYFELPLYSPHAAGINISPNKESIQLNQRVFIPRTQLLSQNIDEDCLAQDRAESDYKVETHQNNLMSCVSFGADESGLSVVNSDTTSHRNGQQNMPFYKISKYSKQVIKSPSHLNYIALADSKNKFSKEDGDKVYLEEEVADVLMNKTIVNTEDSRSHYPIGGLYNNNTSVNKVLNDFSSISLQDVDDSDLVSSDFVESLRTHRSRSTSVLLRPGGLTVETLFSQTCKSFQDVLLESSSKVSPDLQVTNLQAYDEDDSKRINFLTLNILVVDDSYLNRKIVRRIIEGDKNFFSSSQLQEADDGVTALEVMRTQTKVGLPPFDCILMDNIMINMHGPEAALYMRQQLNYRGIIIGITGNALPADISKFVSNGANEVLIKPLTKAKLTDTLLRHFNYSRDV